METQELAMSSWRTIVSRYRRIDHPFEKTIKKIYETPESTIFLGDRLREGR